MRQARIRAEADQVGVYHCTSQIVGGQMLFDDVSKEKFVSLLHSLAPFYEVELITYCIKSNHFHVLVRIPPKRDSQSPTDQELLAKLRDFYGKKGILTVQAQACLDKGRPIDPEIRHRVMSRVRDASVFIQELKQRFSRWYNKLHDRSGYLWGERFQSVLVEDVPSAIKTIEAMRASELRHKKPKANTPDKDD